MRKWIFLFIVLKLITSCSHIQRSSESGYSQDSIPSDAILTYDHSTQKILAELGMTENDLNTADGIKKFKEKIEIKSREAQLYDDREKKQYYQNLPWFKDTEEQLEFLRQNGYYARHIWLRKKNIGKRPVELDKPTEDLIASKDIALGMPAEFVKRSWGNPDSIDVAGNSLYGNERWRYKRYTPSPEGYKLQSRIIYFESGKVAGWEQIDH